MTPRRLLPFLAAFLVLAASFYFLEWKREEKARQKEEAKKLFAVKEADISSVTLQRGPKEIRLAKEGQDWHLTHPLKDRGDRLTMNSLLVALAYLKLERDLGPQKDLTPFGLDQPPLVVTFTAGEKTHTLALGKKTPGNRGYYARRDQEPRVLVIAAATKASLDRPLSALRDRTLFDFPVNQVKALRVKHGSTQVDLEKTGDSWRWVGRENFTVYPDRLERLLRYVSLARVKEFVADAPQDLRTFGLAPPAVEITVVTNKGEQRLSLGARKKDDCYARKGDKAPVVLMESLILDLLTSPLESVASLKKNPLWANLRGTFPQYLEDRRLWTGEVSAVSVFTWGPPGKTWTASKDKDFFNLTGPNKNKVRQPAALVELALLKLRDLEGKRRGTPGPQEDHAVYSVELKDAGGKNLFRLEEFTADADLVTVRFATGADQPQGAQVLKAAFDQWRQDMERLTKPLPGSKK